MMHENIPSQPVIAAQEFDLRPMTRADIGPIELYGGDNRVARMTPSIPHPLPPGAAEAFVQRASDQNRIEDVWVLDASRFGGARFMGLISLERMDRNQSEIAYWVAPAFWGQGVAQAAVAALISNNPARNDTIFASVFQDNEASARVLTKLGFNYLGDAETFCIARNASVATWTYSIKLTDTRPQ